MKTNIAAIRTKRLLFLAMAGLAANLLATQARANIVLNGSFENNSGSPNYSPNDWSLSGSGTAYALNLPFSDYLTLSAHSGDYLLAMGSMATADVLSQSLTTPVGGTYDLSFWMTSDSPDTTGSSLTILWNGSTVRGPISFTPFNSGDPYNSWGLFSITGLAPDLSGFSTLEFLASSFDFGPSLYLDDVSVDPTAVPEPGQLVASLVLLSGLGGFVLRRRLAARRGA